MQEEEEARKYVLLQTVHVAASEQVLQFATLQAVHVAGVAPEIATKK